MHRRWPTVSPPGLVVRLVGLALAVVVVAISPGTARGQSEPAEPPIPAPPVADPTAPTSPIPSHDWRTPGFVAVVDGALYDPLCRPLRSVGSNLPNLLFRHGIRENLEWMRWHHMRWLRVIATGHGHTHQHPDVLAGGVEGRLAAVLREVEAFNAAHDPSESIFVLVSLTDYYEPGVPGDQYGFDKSGWCELRVLNAPWYRRGVPRYDFQQECGGGRLANAPNYEVHYKPWVERIVAVGARSPALLGWQLGNEMKARKSPANGIDEGYTWYLDWMQDMVDTIRRIDRAHPIFAGAQYLAELTDSPYRVSDVAVKPEWRPVYQGLFDRALRACGTYCWNVWSLTNYDFRLYAVDDAVLLDRRGVAAVITEYGFTLGERADELQRFGGDRRTATRAGLDRPWEDLDGVWHLHQWGTLELLDRAGLDGVAPWGSPNPDPGADPWLDLDSRRGISNVPEGADLWDLWRQTGAHLESLNRAAGASAACLAYRSQ